MNKIEIEGKEILYKVSWGGRGRAARVKIQPYGAKVVVPESSDVDPHEFIKERKDWLLKNYEELQEVLAEFPDRKFEDGESFPYLGEDHEIVYSDIEKPQVKKGEIRLPREDIKSSSADSVLEDFLRERAREEIHEVIENYIDQITGTYNKVYIRNQKTKWGSCSSKRNLSFNFRLIMAPPEVLEYVVVHELVHLEVPRHCTDFRRKLSELLPGYQESSQWIEENKRKLVFRIEDLF